MQNYQEELLGAGGGGGGFSLPQNNFLPSNGGYIPSTDFQLFQIPQFGELFANSLGLSTRFQANDPLQYVNYSMDSLQKLLQPQSPLIPPSIANYGKGFELPNIETMGFFQTPSQKDYDAAYKEFIRNNPDGYGGVITAKQAREAGARAQGGNNKVDVTVYPAGTLPPELQGKGNVKPADGDCIDYATGKAIPCEGQSNVEKKKLSDYVGQLPKGTGALLLGIAAIFLVIIFLKK